MKMTMTKFTPWGPSFGFNTLVYLSKKKINEDDEKINLLKILFCLSFLKQFNFSLNN